MPLFKHKTKIVNNQKILFPFQYRLKQDKATSDLGHLITVCHRRRISRAWVAEA